MGEEGEDGGVLEGGVVVGVEVHDGVGDGETVIEEEVGQLMGFEPVDAFLAFVGIEERVVGGVEGVAVVADEEAGVGIEGVPGFHRGAGLVGECQVSVGIPLIFGDIAFEFGVGDEGGEIEPAVGVEGAVEGLEEAGGVVDELEGEGGEGERGIGVGEFEELDVGMVENGVEGGGCGLFAAEVEHVGGEVDAFDVDAGGEEGEEETTGAAAEFQAAPGMEAVEFLEQFEFAGALFGVPEEVVKSRFEGLVHDQDPRRRFSSGGGFSASSGMMRA